MPTNVVMPQMGESVAEGTVVRWIKKVGDRVDRDEPLFEISTDKVDAEIPSPAAGVLAEIRVKEGETVAVDTVVATIGDRRGGGRANSAGPAAPAGPPGPPDPPTVLRPAGTLPDLQGPQAAPDLRRGRPPRAVLAAGAPHRQGAPRRHRHVHGSGISGRVTKEDILKFLGAPARAGQRRRPWPCTSRRSRPASAVESCRWR